MRIVLTILLMLSFYADGKAQAPYKFIGNGKWSDSANWLNRIIPPDILVNEAHIIISPVDTGECILDVPQFVSTLCRLTIDTGSRFVLLSEFVFGSVQDSIILTGNDFYVLDSLAVIDPTLIQFTRLAHRTNGIKETLITSMLNYAKALADKKVQVPANLNPAVTPHPGKQAPAHYGYAYRWGTNKDISMRHYANTNDADNTHKNDSVVGTDCSGFIWQLLKNSGVTMVPAGSKDLASSLNRQLQTATNAALNELRVDSLGAVSQGQLTHGDFLIWKAKGHIGIIGIDRNGVKYLYNSNGQPNPETNRSEKRPKTIPKTYKTIAEEQAANYGPSRGIHPVPLIGIADWFGNTYSTFRFETVNVTANSPTAITASSATINGSFQYTGINEIIDRGVCWNSTGKPEVNKDSKVSKGAGTSPFICNLTNLLPNKNYKARTYTTIRNNGQANDKGITYYGTEFNFTTSGASVIGTWQFQFYADDLNGNNTLDDFEKDMLPPGSGYIKFNADGTGEYKEGTDPLELFTWTLINNQTQIRFDLGGGDIYDYDIVQLNATSLIIGLEDEEWIGFIR